jgi:hypothetical protein
VSQADVSRSVCPLFRTSWEGNKEYDEKQMVKPGRGKVQCRMRTVELGD